MTLKGEDAELLLKLLDSGNSEVHMQWRKTTHKPENVAKIAAIVSFYSESDSPNIFMDAFEDGMRHIADDEMLNKLIYGNKKKEEDSSGVDINKLLALIAD